ncbi:hypothetical protein E1100_25770 [Vibrio owensii]|uniref:hypothetical protein n=1 Tax=Vibrio owensii TaxID=696485 RepID=UPI001048AA3C|nr:hypothetical protein [Vibrio owensii]TDE19271.1 hypothetical protein E1100_25770 [Vibrio owensii]
MNAFTQWVDRIIERSNDDALLLVMFNNDKSYKGALYRKLLGLPNELMAQYSTERTVRAYLHLIKRAHLRQQEQRVTQYALELNHFLWCYAMSLVAITQKMNCHSTINQSKENYM